MHACNRPQLPLGAEAFEQNAYEDADGPAFNPALKQLRQSFGAYT